MSRKALLANENEHVVSELTHDFIDEFIEIIREIFSTRKSTANKKGALAHAWSKKFGHFRNNSAWRNLCSDLDSNSEVEISRVDEVAVLSGIHEAIYDATHSLSHKILLKLPSQNTSANRYLLEDRVILHRFGGNIHATLEIKLSAED